MSRIDDYHKTLEANALTKSQFADSRKDLRIDAPRHMGSVCASLLNETLRSAEFEALFHAALERKAQAALGAAKAEAEQFMTDTMPLEKPAPHYVEVPS